MRTVNFVVTNNAVHKLSRCILRQGTNGVISCRRTHLQSVAEQATIRRDDKTSSLGIVACQTLGARWTYAFAGFLGDPGVGRHDPWSVFRPHQSSEEELILQSRQKHKGKNKIPAKA